EPQHEAFAARLAGIGEHERIAAKAELDRRAARVVEHAVACTGPDEEAIHQHALDHHGFAEVAGGAGRSTDLAGSEGEGRLQMNRPQVVELSANSPVEAPQGSREARRGAGADLFTTGERDAVTEAKAVGRLGAGCAGCNGLRSG